MDKFIDWHPANHQARNYVNGRRWRQSRDGTD